LTDIPRDDFDRLLWEREQADATRQARERRLALEKTAPEDRHTGTDKGMHHWAAIVNEPGWQPSVTADDTGTDPLHVIARLRDSDPLTQAERAAAERQAAYEAEHRRYGAADIRDGQMAGAYLNMRIRMSPRYPE